MKNSILKTLALFAFIAGIALPSKLNAQITSCPYQIYNGTGCVITVDYMLYSGGMPCAPVTGNVINPGTFLTIPCSVMYTCGGPQWDIDVTITDFAGIPVSTPQTVNSTNVGPLNWGPCAASVPVTCCLSSSFNIGWGPNTTKIW